MAGADVVVTAVTAVTLLAEVLVVAAVLDVRVAAVPAFVLVGTEVEVDVVCAPFEVVGGSGAPGRWVGLQPERQSHRGTATATIAHAARAEI